MKSVPPFPQLTSQLKACLTQQKEEPDKGQAMMIPMPRNKPEPLYRDMTRPPPTWTSLSRRNPNRKVEVWEDGLSGQRVTRMREERVSECLHVCRGGWLCHEWSVLMPTVHVSWADHRPARSRRQTQSKWRLCGGTWRHSRRVPLHSASIVLCEFRPKNNRALAACESLPRVMRHAGAAMAVFENCRQREAHSFGAAACGSGPG